MAQPLTGYGARSSQTGWIGMDIVPKNIACLLGRTSANSSSIRWAKMGGDCWPRSSQTPKATGCSPSQLLIPCSACGNKTTCHRMREAPGLLMRIAWNRRSSSFLLMILMHQRRRSAQRMGLETKRILLKRDEDLPRLITQLTTTIAPTPDRQALPDVHAVLDQRDLLPEHHLVDAG